MFSWRNVRLCHCRILSCLQTVSDQKINPHVTVQMALVGEFLEPAIDGGGVVKIRVKLPYEKESCLILTLF